MEMTKTIVSKQNPLENGKKQLFLSKILLEMAKNNCF